MSNDLRARALFDQINALETRLTPAPVTRRRRLLDAASLVLLLPVAALLDWNISHPILLLMVGSNVFGHVILPYLQGRKLRRERDRLISRHDEIVAAAALHRTTLDA